MLKVEEWQDGGVYELYDLIQIELTAGGDDMRRAR
jgi:hypothetical protein